MSTAYEPPRTGSVPVDAPLPDHLPLIGTRVILSDGQPGVVDYYEFYHLTQATFPVRSSGFVSVQSALSVVVAPRAFTADASVSPDVVRQLGRFRRVARITEPPARDLRRGARRGVRAS